MPSPETSLSTQRPDISPAFEEFGLEAQRMGFVAYRCLPVAQVAKANGNYGKISIEQLLQSPETKRAPGSNYNRGHWTFDDATYTCLEYGWEEPVDDREAAMYSDYFDAEVVSARRAFEFVLGAAERRVAALMFNATTFSGQTTSAGASLEWDDYTNAVPITDVENASQAVHGRTGIWPNAMVISRKVFRNLRNCDQVINRITASGAGDAAKPSDISAEQLARVFDLEEVIVAGASKNTANEGASASVADIWDDEYAMVFVKPRTNDFREPCLGRTFHWSEDGSDIGGTIESYREEQSRSEIIRVRHDVDEQLIYTEAAQLIDNVTS